jgi:hypothetical protein
VLPCAAIFFHWVCSASKCCLCGQRARARPGLTGSTHPSAASQAPTLSLVAFARRSAHRCAAVVLLTNVAMVRAMRTLHILAVSPAPLYDEDDAANILGRCSCAEVRAKRAMSAPTLLARPPCLLSKRSLSRARLPALPPCALSPRSRRAPTSSPQGDGAPSDKNGAALPQGDVALVRRRSERFATVHSSRSSIAFEHTDDACIDAANEPRPRAVSTDL